MKHSFVFLLAILSLIVSCSKDNGSTANRSCKVSGRYFNRTVLDQCPVKRVSEIPYYALELVFRGNDTVTIDNGIERYHLTYQPAEEKCTYKIESATQFGDMLFTVSSDTSLILHDSAWTKVNTSSQFASISDVERKDWSFVNLLNECVIAGEYTITRNDDPDPVHFFSNGQVSGLRPLLFYELCYAGDCLEETEVPSDLIEFTNDKGQKVLYVYMFEADRSKVKFFNIGEPIPDIKGNRPIGELAFEIVKRS